MTWWAWTLLWVVLVLGSLWVFFVLGRSLWRRAVALLDELGTASERLAEVSGELSSLGERAAAADLAVFADPEELRRRRSQQLRRRARERARRTRQAARR